MMAPKKINSESNSTFRLFLKLTKARGIKKNGLALLSGPKQVKEVLQEFPDRCAGILFSQHHELPSESSATDIPCYCLDAGLFRQIDLFETGQPILLVRVDPFPKWDEISEASGCTLCVPFQDPANVGAAIRSAAAFGLPRVVFLKEAAHPFHPKSVRVAGSTLFRVPVFEGPSLYELKLSQVPVITLSPEGKDVKDFTFPASFFLVPGLEGPGLPDHLREATCLSVPMASGVESINAAMATGIILYVWRSQLAIGD
ncbi:MAG: RNA methyltransferase [Deltaproteobacteria bacterium]|nr:RNA methyltransferase [Deltaproteobacteria bacterium]